MWGNKPPFKPIISGGDPQLDWRTDFRVLVEERAGLESNCSRISKAFILLNQVTSGDLKKKLHIMIHHGSKSRIEVKQVLNSWNLKLVRMSSICLWWTDKNLAYQVGHSSKGMLSSRWAGILWTRLNYRTKQWRLYGSELVQLYRAIGLMLFKTSLAINMCAQIFFWTFSSEESLS